MEDDQNDDLQDAKDVLRVNELLDEIARKDRDLAEWLAHAPMGRATFRWWQGWFS